MSSFDKRTVLYLGHLELWSSSPKLTCSKHSVCREQIKGQGWQRGKTTSEDIVIFFILGIAFSSPLFTLLRSSLVHCFKMVRHFCSNASHSKNGNNKYQKSSYCLSIMSSLDKRTEYSTWGIWGYSAVPQN